MEKLALMVRLEAKAGKEKELSDFIKSALPLAIAESFTSKWYALQLGPAIFGIFDSFENEEGRSSHLGGQIAQALMKNAPHLLVRDPVIEKADILAVK